MACFQLARPLTFPFADPEDDVYNVASAAPMGFLTAVFELVPGVPWVAATRPLGQSTQLRSSRPFSLGVRPGDGAALRRPVATLPVESFNVDSPLWQRVSPSLLSPSVQIGLLYPCGISVLLVLAGSLTGG